jgi:hypothetical protein
VTLYGTITGGATLIGARLTFSEGPAGVEAEDDADADGLGAADVVGAPDVAGAAGAADVAGAAGAADVAGAAGALVEVGVDVAVCGGVAVTDGAVADGGGGATVVGVGDGVGAAELGVGVGAAEVGVGVALDVDDSDGAVVGAGWFAPPISVAATTVTMNAPTIAAPITVRPASLSIHFSVIGRQPSSMTARIHPLAPTAGSQVRLPVLQELPPADTTTVRRCRQRIRGPARLATRERSIEESS